ncbi:MULTISPECIES: AMP-binding protein [unclassified Dysgonomonas]|uniref:AMP-binding protein n=1 Tax=unclassified Dysgonomonas TaxID=2630389 RepID=UPI000681D8BC|nr:MULTISPECIES: AMP-binding protein [unclassified Dysgonomonas]MBD8348212.1 AMP-binding protein [Dysgonomonas sp. HGC4]MBF0575810.1 AMP-binding protein [Dysgonomonas sp. GY617]
MLEKFLKQIEFTSTEDFKNNFHVNIPDNFNFAYDIVDEWAKTKPSKIALCWSNEEGEHIDFTFQDIKEQSDKAASFFQSLGIGKGDKVMLILKRRYEFWFAIVGLHKIGAVAIPATHLLTPKDIIYRNNAADIKAIVTTDDDLIRKHVDEALSQSPTIKHLITWGDNTPDGWKNFYKGLDNAKPFARPEHVNNNEDISILYFTSGTTGEPKMVIHNFTYPLGHIVTAKYWHNLTEDSVHLTVSDTGWAKAVWGKLYGQWIVGATVVAYDHEKFTSAKMLELIEKYKITSFCAPPTVYRFMIRDDISKYDLSSLKYCTTAGEALNASVFEAFYKATGIKMMEAFGQTETTPTIITFPWLEPKPGAMGVSNPAYDIDLITAEGRSAEEGESGEVVIKTNNGIKPLGLFMGYYRDEALTNQVYYDNVYHTGDVAWRDEDGYFWFIGRLDDVIKSSGYRIGPFEVESALMTHPAVVECAITGVPDEIRGQIIKATIVLASDYKAKAGEALIKEIQDHVKKVTAPYKYPRIIEFVEELPKTISGKIKRAEIRKR